MLPLVMSTPLAASSYAALTVGGAKCGTKICEIYQFCSKFHTGCEDCSLICDADGHNFEEEICFKDCQSKFDYYDCYQLIYYIIEFVQFICFIIFFL